MPTIQSQASDTNLHLTIYYTGPGWKIVVERLVENRWTLHSDRWEEKLADIVQYASDYTSTHLVWTEAGSDRPIDLAKFVEEHEDK